MSSNQQNLRPEVAEKYQVTGLKTLRHHFNGFGRYDLAKIDLRTADALVANKFPFLKEKLKKAPLQELARKPVEENQDPPKP